MKKKIKKENKERKHIKKKRNTQQQQKTKWTCVHIPVADRRKSWLSVRRGIRINHHQTIRFCLLSVRVRDGGRSFEVRLRAVHFSPAVNVFADKCNLQKKEEKKKNQTYHRITYATYEKKHQEIELIMNDFFELLFGTSFY